MAGLRPSGYLLHGPPAQGRIPTLTGPWGRERRRQYTVPHTFRGTQIR